jgi:hypothetical protein
MNIEEKIEECEYILKRMRQFDPDPYYVNYFFNSYLLLVNKVYAAIFEEANRDFGLFVLEKFDRDGLLEKAKIKNDQKAIDFILWFDEKYDEEHKNTYPNFIKKSCKFQKDHKKLPKIKIMISAKERYPGDPNQEITTDLKNEKLKSKDELQIEIKRQIPIFLEITNYKRSIHNEPKINEKQVFVSTFLDIDCNDENIEIAYASKIYISVMERFLIEAREKIRELTIWR